MKICSALGVAILLGSSLLCTTMPLWAADVPGFEKSVLIQAREQPIDGFIEELFGRIGVPVVIADGIEGTVNGDFSKAAGEIFDDVARSFQLTLYHDGAVAFVYPASDVRRSLLPMSETTGLRVLDNARNLGLIDTRNRLTSSDAGLVVTGTRRFAEQIDEIADAVDKGVPAVESIDIYRVFRLKYAWADDVSLAVGGQELVVPGVVSLLRTLVEPGALSAPGSRRSQDARTRPGLKGQGLQAVGEPEPDGADALASEVEGRPGDGVDADVSSTRFVADSLHNAVIIRDRPERMANYEQLIRSLDVEPKMVEIEATIIDLDTGRLRELGINWRLQGGDGEALLGQGSEADGQLRPGGDVSASGRGGIVSLVLGDRDNFISRIRALEEQQAARIVSKPHVLTLSNVEALLDTTSTFFVRVEGQEEVDLFDVSVGTTLRVTPHVFDDGGRAQIKLLVTIQDGSTSDQRVDNIPVIETSTVNTQALIDVGQSLLIGGLVRELKADSVTKVPVLGSIPGLGALFRSNSQTSRRVERMFLITPRLSLRPNVASSRRLSVPYLAGTESEIISSAPTRTAQVAGALAARDETFPLVDALPRPGGTADLDVPGVGAEVVPLGEAGAHEDPASPRSLRDRLRRGPEPQQVEDPWSTQEVLLAPSSTGVFSDADVNAVWTRVPSTPRPTSASGGSERSGRMTATTHEREPSALPADTDPDPWEATGWQAVGE